MVIFTHFTRACSDIDVPRCRPSKTTQSFPISGMKLFNLFPFLVRSLPTLRFVNVVNAWLMENPFYFLKEFFDSNKSMEELSLLCFVIYCSYGEPLYFNSHDFLKL